MRNKENQKIKTALIGYGYWGKILASKFINHPHFELKYICDPKLDLDEAHFKNQPIHFIQDQSIILNDAEIKAVLIAVPPIFHYQVAKACLLSKKHVWLEKPACTNLEDFEILNHLAKQHQCILHIDYLYLFNPLIHTMKRLIKGEKIISFHSIRTNQNHIGARSGLGDTLDLIYDLGVHDLSILKSICDELEMIDIQINIKSNLNMVDLEIWEMNLENQSKIDVKIHLNWKALAKIREVKITTDRKEVILTLDQSYKEILLIKDLSQSKDQEIAQNDVMDDLKNLDVLSLSINAFYGQIQSNTQNQMILDIASVIHQKIALLKDLI